MDTNNVLSNNKLKNQSTSNKFDLEKIEVFTISKIIESCINRLKMVRCLKEVHRNNLKDSGNWNFVIRTLLVINQELKSQGSWQFLKDILDHEATKSEELSTLITKIKTSDTNIKKLEFQLKEDRKKFQKELEDRNHAIEEQNDELHRITEQNVSELQFEKEWLQVQIEESDLRNELEELELQQRIKNLNNDIEEEENVHNEIMWYYENEENNVENLTKYWQERQKDINEREVELQKLNELQKKQYEELQFFKMMYTTRVKEIDEYLADKEYRRKQYEYEQYRQRQAIKIQAWWRGVMVRRYLGPFKHLLKLKCSKKRKSSLKKGSKK